MFLGFQSKELIVKAGLALGDVDQYPDIDVTIDGADEWVLYYYQPIPDTESYGWIESMMG